ncbi:MurR/RpiR family transcriptional regulator [Vagococcus fluvialis]|uniref:MurR/RpiR family transcriptional regulator n=1 Tax=Vagococcus fluvialis TaxID=2738 RepID=UPI001D0B52CB|nr:MurR/RpiR family transcriptional regulator [Vagococcus fluvialis]UDM72820.1 MurR/RpiR family transcriptional regulator [Vagococcus fluvialis]
MSLQKNISIHADELTEMEKDLLQSLLLDQQKMDSVDFTVSKLSEKYNVSRTSVHRLSQKIGYKSFTLFKHDFFVTTIKDEEYDKEEAYFLNSMIENYHIVNKSITNEILEKLIKSKRIIIYGMGMSSYIGKMFQVKLLLYGMNSEQYDDSQFMRISAANLNPEEDVVLVLSRSGKPPELLEAIVTAKTKKVSMILVTENRDSPLGHLADYIIDTSQSVDQDISIDTRLNVHVAMDILMKKLVKKKEEGSKEADEF